MHRAFGRCFDRYNSSGFPEHVRRRYNSVFWRVLPRRLMAIGCGQVNLVTAYDVGARVLEWLAELRNRCCQ